MSSIEDGKIYIFHLVNNTTVVGMVQSQNEDSIVLTKPMELLTMPGPGGTKGALMPYLSMGKFLPDLQAFPLTYDLILFPRECTSSIENAYREETGMLAVPASPSIILPT
jgi:hypothetical protein